MEYSRQNQTYKFLSNKYFISIKTLQKRLDSVVVSLPFITPYDTVIIMDTCYFRDGFGVMVFRDSYQKRNLYWKFIKHETLKLYIEGITTLLGQGWQIKAIVCDGKRGLFNAFGKLPIQMCQFHQTAIVTRYITKRPKLQAGKELKEVVHLLTRSDKESFTGALEQWHQRWQSFLSEKTINPETKKWHYTHKRIRSAYRSLNTNLPYLYTWYDNMELNIPNTTNSIEETFSNIKTKLRVHSGLKLHRKIKLINELLKK
jgi:hypothetical protein